MRFRFPTLLRRLLTLIMTQAFLSTASASEQCESSYAHGERVGGAYGEMVGIVEGTIYGYAIHQPKGTHCLSGSPKQQVQSIAQTLKSDAFISDPILFSDVPSREEVLKFLYRFHPCETSGVIP